jgi:Flp pilus assembly protein TadG
MIAASTKSIMRLGRCTSGTALLETIIVLPLLLVVMIGVVDYAWSLSMQATASKSMRGAARYLSLLPGAAACSAWAQTNAQNLAVYGNMAGTGAALVPAWQTNGTDSYATITADPTGCATNCPAYVEAKAQIPLSTIIAALIPIPATLTLSTQHLERPTPYIGEGSGC